MAGRWTVPFLKRSYPKLTLDGYTRENDITFSFGRPTTSDEVISLLVHSGCVNAETYPEEISMMRINHKNVDNGQVFITSTKPGLSDLWVEKLIALEGTTLKKCHAYTNKEVHVRVSYIHSSMDISQFVREHLEKYGKVKDWWKNVDYKYGLYNGIVTCIMFEDQLKLNPIPEKVVLNNVDVHIYYASRKQTCHICNGEDHLVEECPKKVSFPDLASAKAAGCGSVFLPTVLPVRKLRKVQQKEKEVPKTVDTHEVVDGQTAEEPKEVQRNHQKNGTEENGSEDEDEESDDELLDKAIKRANQERQDLAASGVLLGEDIFTERTR